MNLPRFDEVPLKSSTPMALQISLSAVKRLGIKNSWNREMSLRRQVVNKQTIASKKYRKYQYSPFTRRVVVQAKFNADIGNVICKHTSLIQIPAWKNDYLNSLDTCLDQMLHVVIHPTHACKEQFCLLPVLRLWHSWHVCGHTPSRICAEKTWALPASPWIPQSLETLKSGLVKLVGSRQRSHRTYQTIMNHHSTWLSRQNQPLQLADCWHPVLAFFGLPWSPNQAIQQSWH